MTAKRSRKHVSNVPDMDSKGLTSLDSFNRFVKYTDGKCDASGILSTECYELWHSTRRILAANPEDSFRRTITAHVTGTKKRKPFSEEVERSLLPRLRARQVWPCFEGRTDKKGDPITIGRTGFRAKGHFEQKCFEKQNKHSIVNIKKENSGSLGMNRQTDYITSSSIMSNSLSRPLSEENQIGQYLLEILFDKHPDEMLPLNNDTDDYESDRWSQCEEVLDKTSTSTVVPLSATTITATNKGGYPCEINGNTNKTINRDNYYNILGEETDEPLASRRKLLKTASSGMHFVSWQ